MKSKGTWKKKHLKRVLEGSNKNKGVPGMSRTEYIHMRKKISGLSNLLR